MPTPNFGAAYGQRTLSGTGVTALINGLTVSSYLTVTNAVAGPGTAFIGDQYVTTSRGYALEPGNSVVLNTLDGLNTWYVTTDGSSCRISWVAS